MAAAVVTLSGGVPEEDVVVKQETCVVTETWEYLRKTRNENKLAR